MRERRGKGLRQMQDMLGTEIGDDEPDETSCRQRSDVWAAPAGSSSGAVGGARVGDQQRCQRAAVAEHHVAEAASLVDARMSFQQLEWTVDHGRLERGERTIWRTVPASGIDEVDRALG